MEIEKILVFYVRFIVSVFISFSEAHVACTVNGISYTCTNIPSKVDFPLLLPANIQQVTIFGRNNHDQSFTTGLFRHHTWTNVSELSILEFINAKIIEKEFLDGLDKLKFLSISSCPDLESIDPDVFHSTPELEELHLDENYNLKLGEVEATLNGRLSKLRHLSLIGIQATKSRVVLGETFSKALHAKNLIGLVISRVRLIYIEHYSVLETLAKLKYLNISYSAFLLAAGVNWVHTDLARSKIELLDCTGCPYIVKYDMKTRDLNATRDTPSNLMYLFFKGITYPSTELRLNLRYMFTDYHFRGLQILDLSKNNIIILNITFYGSYYFPALEALNLASNNMEYISPSFLSGFPSLKILDLSDNQFHIMQTIHDFPYIFCKNKDLEIIFLRNNFLSVVPSKLFSSNTKLRIINLSENELAYFNIELSNAMDLKFIDLRKNRLKTLPAVFLEQLEQIFWHQRMLNTHESSSRLFRQFQDKTLIAEIYKYGYNASENVKLAEKTSSIPRYLMMDLLMNPILCDCDTLDFLKWILFTDIMIYNRTTISCNYGNKEELLNKEDYAMVKRNCQLATMIGLVTGSLAAVTLGIFTFAAIIHLWHRWARPKQDLENLRREILQVNTNFNFVVFLSYCSQDVHIVDEIILPSLNRILKEKLNTEKDLVCTGADSFVPGMLIIDEIHRCINESLVVVPVITPSFLQSSWSLKECVVALENHRQVVVLMKQHTNTNNTADTIKQLIAHYTRAAWSDNEGQFIIRPSWNTIGEAIISVASETFRDYRKQKVNTPNESIPLVDQKE